MLALDANDWGAIAGLISAAIAIGIVARPLAERFWTSRFIKRPGSQAQIEELRDDVAEVRDIMVNRVLPTVAKISETLAGREPSAFEPRPPMGLVGVVLHHGEVLERLVEQNDDRPPSSSSRPDRGDGG